MQFFKVALGYVIRLLAVDVLLLVFTWIANTALAIKETLAPYALGMKTSDPVDLKKVDKKILEIEEYIFLVQSAHTKHVDKSMGALRKQIEEMARDIYEEVEETPVSINSTQKVMQ